MKTNSTISIVAESLQSSKYKLDGAIERLFTADIAKKEIKKFFIEEKRIPTTSENVIIRKVYDRIQKGSKQLKGEIKNWPHLISISIQELEDKDLKRELTSQYQKKIYYNRKREWKTYGLRFNSKNELKSKRPDLIKEIHPTLNYGKLPLKMHYKSDTQLWWVCDINHKYRMSVSARTIDNKNCPICNFPGLEKSYDNKPKYFWQTIDPGYNFAIEVIIDFFLEHERVPIASDTENINRIYKALRNPKVKKTWGIENWAELLRITISNIGYEMGKLRDKLILSYNKIAESQKHRGWVKIL